MDKGCTHEWEFGLPDNGKCRGECTLCHEVRTFISNPYYVNDTELRDTLFRENKMTEPRKRGNFEELNKQRKEIELDLEASGLDVTKSKWGITDSMWAKLQRHWAGTELPVQPVVAASGLPTWNEAWGDNVKITWLQTYAASLKK
jgi:hypothetical protein